MQAHWILLNGARVQVDQKHFATPVVCDGPRKRRRRMYTPVEGPEVRCLSGTTDRTAFIGVFENDK